MEKIITAVNKKTFAILADVFAEWQMILSVFALRSALYFQEGKTLSKLKSRETLVFSRNGAQKIKLPCC